MNERSPRFVLPRDKKTIGLLLGMAMFTDPVEFGPYRPIEPDEKVNKKHIIIGEDGINRIPARLYKLKGQQPNTYALEKL